LPASAAIYRRAVEIARRVGDQAGLGICPVAGAAAGKRIEGGRLLRRGFARQQDRGNERRRDERWKPAESQIAPAVMQFHRRPPAWFLGPKALRPNSATDVRRYRFELVARLRAGLIFPGEKHD
jgi:hypothetical protein